MDFLELIKIRRSCRKYQSRPIPREVIEKCLEAAWLAPSACNSQPWNFIVVESAEVKNHLAERAFSGIYSINYFAKQAPVLVVVVRKSSVYAAKLGGYLRGTQYNLIDIGIACEHFILAAAEQGVGTCWLGFFNEKHVKKVLGIPARMKVDVIISLGYPQEQISRDKKREPLEAIREYR